MDIKAAIKKYNPIHACILKNRRKKLVNKDFTLFCSNCMGGIIYHDLKLEFKSPTINCRMDSPEFIKFVCDLEHYLKCDLEFIQTDEPFPVAKLDDITVHFVHYKTEDEARLKWEKRTNRINWDNVFILTNDCDGVTCEDLKNLEKLDWVKGIAVLTDKDYKDIPFTIKLSERDMKNNLSINSIKGTRTYEKYLDYVRWFNTGLIKK